MYKGTDMYEGLMCMGDVPFEDVVYTLVIVLIATSFTFRIISMSLPFHQGCQYAMFHVCVAPWPAQIDLLIVLNAWIGMINLCRSGACTSSSPEVYTWSLSNSPVLSCVL